MQYQWAVKITMEYLDGTGAVEQTHVEIREVRHEMEARARHDAIQDTLARTDRVTPKYQRLAASELLRRPVGEWETVADNDEAGKE